MEKKSDMPIKPHFILSGNGMPPWRDIKKSIMRRKIVLSFPNPQIG
jgi:phage/plasmid-associated DNA primase